MRFSTTVLLGVAVSSAALAVAADSVKAPYPVPLTRPVMKQALEDMKGRKERIPLPELTEADKEKLGERSTSYESRLRYHYMPYSDGQGSGGSSRGTGTGGFGRSSDPDMGLDYAFTVELFWLVSRTNNCLY
ncbi:MAG: hypothetical protein FD138_4445 [Planctomycetota bacterium]|nr:MAG: hypothetical protein FD138_4445 [Planctomycetota bacterium]